MNDFIKLSFISNKVIDSYILHSLYTTIRFKENKISNLKEDFKVWKEGKNIFIILEENKIENKKELYEFNNGIKIKFLKKESISKTNFELGDWVRIEGIFSYAYKSTKDKNKEICPIDFKGNFNNIKNKEQFCYYLTNKTGADFFKSIDSKDRVAIKRLFLEDIGLLERKNETKVLMKNLIMINAVVEVVDQEVVNFLNYSSIGKKRSYGLGNMSVTKLNI